MKDLTADIECLGCGHKVTIKVREMVPGRTKNCPYCAAKFRFTGDDGRKVQRGLDDLERQLRKLSRKLTIRF